MLGWSDTRLVGTIFHELAHERLYVSGDSGFNEAFASVVEHAVSGAGWPRRAAEGPRGVRDVAAQTGRVRAAARSLTPRRCRTCTNRRCRARDAQREEPEFGRLKFEYQGLRAQWAGFSGYDAWFARPLDNARLASVATYHDCVPGLERELAAAGSLPVFYARAESLAKLTREARRAAVCESCAERLRAVRLMWQASIACPPALAKKHARPDGQAIRRPTSRA